MKNKFIYIFTLLSALIFLLTGCDENKVEENSISLNKMNAKININTDTDTSNTVQNTINEFHVGLHEVEEQELAVFSTRLGGSDTPRSHNIGITTSILNGITINDGETFSFNNIVGDPTAERGYEEADSFNESGETVKTYGGGNCQVSSTLYNVVLQISDLEVIERSPHIKPVHYVEEGKDATVSYGSVDFKFKNNTGSTIKIYANSDLNWVNARIVKVQ